VFLSSHLLAEIEQLCTRVGVMDRGRLVLQDDLATLRAPTGRVLVGTPTPDRVVALLDGRVEPATATADRAARRPGGAERRTGRRRHAVTEIAAERRTLEQVVLDATGPVPTGWRRRMIRVELAKLFRGRART
jgi:ABC-type multidrug transport system ATPase subunit